MTNFSVDYDAGIIGGGPAGSAMASYLAREGIRCVVFEKEIFPRFHVGESLVPAANRVLRELGLMESMEAAGFPHKFGAAWTSAAGVVSNDFSFEGLPKDLRADIDFRESKNGASQDYTYHVDRAKFDEILLNRSAELGAEVRQGVRVSGVDFPETGPIEIKTVGSSGKEELTRVRVVIDASGRRTLLGRQFNLRKEDPYFNQYALHTWFEGYDRGPGKDKNYVLIHFLPITSTWVWQIPISDTITSFGVVTQKENFRGNKDQREEFFWDSIKTRPDVYERLQQARRVRPFGADGDYSYSMTALSGRGFVLVGDASRFVDPIFSSGISIALNGARQAAEGILRGLRNSEDIVLARSNFEDYETTMRRGMRNWYEFISLYYRLNILFTYFVMSPDYRPDVLKLLQGDVYDEAEPPVLGEMRRIVTMVENNPGHAWHNLLSGLRTDMPQLSET